MFYSVYKKDYFYTCVINSDRTLKDLSEFTSFEAALKSCKELCRLNGGLYVPIEYTEDTVSRETEESFKDWITNLAFSYRELNTIIAYPKQLHNIIVSPILSKLSISTWESIVLNKGSAKANVIKTRNSDYSKISNLEGNTLKFDFSKFSSRGVLVRLSIGRWRATTRLVDADLGINVPDFISLGEKHLLPKDTLNELSNLESKARRNLEKYSINTPWGRFVTDKHFNTWASNNEVIQQEYIKLGETISNNSEALFKIVTNKYTTLAEDIFYKNPGISSSLEEWVRQYLTKILNLLPSKDEIKRSFSYDTFYLEVPTQLNVTGSIRDYIVSNSQVISDEKLYTLAMSQFISSLKSDIHKYILNLENSTENKKKVNKTILTGISRSIDFFISSCYLEDTSISSFIPQLEKVKNLVSNSNIRIFELLPVLKGLDHNTIEPLRLMYL